MNLWPRIGMSIAIVAAFCIAVMEALQPTPLYEGYKWHFCGCLAGAAVAFLLIGFPLNSRRARLAKMNGIEYEGPFFLTDLAFWGMVAGFCALTTSFIMPSYRPPMVQTRALKTNTPPATSSVPLLATAPQPAAPRPFPALALQGITYQGKASSALINGKTLFIGEHVNGAVIVNITPNSVTLEMDGESKVLELPH